MAIRVYVDEVKVEKEDPEPWMGKAACKQEETNIFFEHPATKALKHCKGCPVVLDCLAFALRTEPPGHRRYGILGGKTPAERERLAQKLKEMRKQS